MLLEADIHISLSTPMSVLSVSDSIENLLGFKADAFLTGDVSLASCIHPNDQDIADELFSSDISTPSGTFNIRLRQANGLICCIKGHYTKKHDAVSNNIVLDLLLQDAKSLHKKQDEQAITSNFKAIMENTDDYIYFKDRNHVFTGASETLVSLTTPSKHWTDLLGQTDYDVFPEEYADIYYELEKQVFSGIHIAHDEQKILNNNSSTGWVDNRKYPIHNDSGEIVGLFGIARDITESKKKQEVIEHLLSEEIAILDNQLVGIVTVRDRKIIWANSAFESMLGYDKDELIGSETRQLYTNDEDYQFIGSAYADIKSKGVIKNELEFACKDGHHMWVDLRGTELLEDENESLWVFVDVTERKLSDLALAHSEEKFRTLFNSTHDAVMILDNMKFIDTNHAALLLFGCPDVETFRNMSPADISPPKQPCGTDSEILAKQQIELAIKNGNHSFEWVHKRIDTGEIFTAEVLISAMNLYGKTVVQGTVRDITERKRIENLLRKNEERLRLSQLYGRIGSWEYDFITNQSQCSDVVLQELGFPLTPNSSTWDDVFAAIHPEDRDHVDDVINQHIEKGTVLDVEYRIIDTQKKTLWMRTIGKVEFDSTNTPVKMFGTVQEITSQKEAQDNLRIAATAFETQEGMIVTDADSMIIKVNKAFTSITGYTSNDAIGKTPHILQSGQYDADFYKDMWVKIEQTGHWDGEVTNRHKNGHTYIERLTITAVKDADGIVTNYVGTHTDITERKLSEDKIIHLAFYDHLTHLANRRLLMDRLHHALAASARNGNQGALLFLDLDYFKDLNDTHGHDIGDILLQQVAERLTSCVREGDTVSRLGGDEFVVILENLDKDHTKAITQTKNVANKILTALGKPYQLAEHEYTSSTSIGATLFYDHLAGVEELLKQADTAMYQAKRNGRNALSFFDL